MLGDEGGVDDVVLDVMAAQLVEEPGRGSRRRAVQVQLRDQVVELLAGELLAEVPVDRHACLLLDLLHHRDPGPRRGEVDLDRLALGSVRVVLDLVAAFDVQDHGAEKLLGDVHKIVVVGVGHVELTSCELRIVRHVHALIPEVAADLVNAVQAANHEHLEVQLGRDPHEQVHVQVVVVRDEGLRGCAAGDHVHHRGLDLQETSGVQVVSDVVDDFRPCVKGVPDVLVDHQVQVPLAEPNLRVLETLVILRQHVQASRQQLHLLWEDGQLTRLGLAHEASDADDVAAVENGVRLLEVSHFMVLRLAHDLDAGTIGKEVVKQQAHALSTLVLHASCNGDHGAHFVGLRWHILVLLNEGWDGGINRPLVRVGVLQGLDHGHSVLPVLRGIQLLHIFLLGLGAGCLLLRSLLSLFLLLLCVSRLGLCLFLKFFALRGRQLIHGCGLGHLLVLLRNLLVGQSAWRKTQGWA
mmetsp:Transcript_76663/g.206681  ORF Transcript_76663/g.206681 Transcript_76663/m.206681 type:complete len:467 (+) Transcript_76663:568-1968(+)